MFLRLQLLIQRLRSPKGERAKLKKRHREFLRRFFANEPIQFRWVGNEGIPVGPPLEIYHLTFHDMMAHEVEGQMTVQTLLHGLRANAVERVRFTRTNNYNGVTIIQPRWVDAPEEASDVA